MEKSLQEKVKIFKYSNEIALKNEIVILGSTYMANFPFYELINKYQLENAVYNRSIEKLSISLAEKFLKELVIEIKPKKIFIALGEEDYKLETATTSYNNIIRRIRSELPYSTLYLITIPCIDEKASLFNQNIQNLCDGKKIIKIDFIKNYSSKNIEYKAKFRILARFFRNKNIAFADAFNLAEI